ncbi:MAG: hypothetical protein WB643_02755 [Candidatus Bathyarchaeia archaeon]
MVRRYSGLLCIGIFILSVFAVSSPVQAHFTLGDLTGTYRFHSNDFDPHVPGVIGYVWPGSGLNTYSGTPNIASSFLSPGYQSPYPGGNPPGAPSNSWYQLESDAYAPFGAVLTGSTGDLIFALNATAGFAGRWQAVDILLPPGFSVPGQPQIVSTITNDYSAIVVARISPYDRYAPGWTLVQVMSDAGMDAVAPASAPYYDHQAIDFTAAGEWYYIRINGVVAPAIAGRYFFKILLEGGTPSTCGEEGTGTGVGPLPGEACSQFIPTENWPVLLVKGEVDPAIVTGTLRYAGYNASLYGLPIEEAGKVWAKMTTRLDPYTGAQRPDLPTVDAQAYVNATATGHFEVEGLAPGIYDLYASAAGYPQTLCASGITILKGQSLHFDCYLQPGPVIHGDVFTKHQFGDEPWPENTYIKIELFDAPTLNHVPDSGATLVSWSPLPCVAGGQQDYVGKYTAGACNDPRLGGAVAFPWHEYVPNNGYFAGASPAAFDFYQVSTGASDGSQSAKVTQDPMGVGPPQHWFVQGGTTQPFHYEFGLKGEYGAPSDLDGMVPQVYATWVNGLTPGRYYVRAWVFRYVQSALDGSTFQEYSFDITPNEWAGDVTIPLDLRLSSWINKTVYFHNTPNTLTTDPIDTGAGVMAGVLVDASGQVWSYNQTLLGYRGLYSTGAKSGWGAGAFSTATTLNGATHRNDLDKAKINANAIEKGLATIQFWGWNDTWGGRNYGIPSGTYTPHVYVLGYLEHGPAEQVSITLSGNPVSISDHMYRGGGFNLTVNSVDWERPRVSRPWVWGNPVGYTATGMPTSIGSGPDFPGDPRNVGGIFMVGEEIDVGVYANGTLIDFIGDVPSNLQDTVLTSCLFQSNTNSTVQLCGGGWEPLNSQLSAYQGNSNDAYFGQELGELGFVGGYTGGISYFSTSSTLFAPAHYSPKTLPDGGTYNQAVTGYLNLYPSAIPTGQYDLRGYTYGYVQDKTFTAYVSTTEVADMKINLIIGVNVTLDILFKKESIITGTLNNMSARVRLFDDSGNLVAEWMSSEGTYTPASGFARAADGTDQYPFGPLHPAVPVPQPLNGYNYLPGNTALLHVLMAGLPQVPAAGVDDGVIARHVPGSVYFNDPLFATTTCGFEVDCYTSPGTGLGVGVPGYFPNTGILGAPDYTGGWTAEVDFVNWYANNTAGGVPHYYPPVQGLLMGESYHIIPGTTATSGISFTEDNALKPELIGHSLAANHLGPYSQQGVWQISNAHLSGEASGIFEVDLNGLVSGNALAFTWSNEFRPLSWGLVNVVGANGASWNFYTYDGIYEAYLTPGTYKFTISSPGYASQTFSVVVSPGQSGVGQNMYLEQSNIPVPEFSAIGIVAFSALAASLFLLRRRRK